MSQTSAYLAGKLRTRAGRLTFGLQIHTALLGLTAYLAAGGSTRVTDAQLGAYLGRSTNHVAVMMRRCAAEGWIDRTPGTVTVHGRLPTRYRINASAILAAIKATVPEAVARRAREATDTAARIARLGPAYLAGHRRKKRQNPWSVHLSDSDIHASLRSASGADLAADAAQGETKPAPPELIAEIRATLRAKRPRLRRD
jgi:hypothetical protein